MQPHALLLTALVLLALSLSPAAAGRRPNFRQNYDTSRVKHKSTSTESKMKKGGVFWKLCAKQLRVAPENQARCVRMMGKQEEKIKRKVSAKVNRVKGKYQDILDSCQKNNQLLEQNRADNERLRRESEQREILLLEKSKSSAGAVTEATRDKELSVCQAKLTGLKSKYMVIRNTYADVLEKAKSCGSVLAACRDKYDECANTRASFPPTNQASSQTIRKAVAKNQNFRNKVKNSYSTDAGAENLPTSEQRTVIVQPPIKGLF